MKPFNMEDFKAGKKVVYRSGITPKAIAALSACIVSEEDELSLIIHGLDGKSKTRTFDSDIYDLMIEDDIYYAGIKGIKYGTAKEFLIAESIRKLKDSGFTDSDIYKLVPTW